MEFVKVKIFFTVPCVRDQDVIFSGRHCAVTTIAEVEDKDSVLFDRL